MPRLESDAPLPPLGATGDALLTCAATGAEVKAATLWRDNTPALVFAVRRPGCMLCRDHAAQLYARRAEVEPGMRLVAVVKEALPGELEAFRQGPWPGELYVDRDRALFKLFSPSGAELRTESLVGMLNPFHPVWRRIFAARGNKDKGNLVGESTVLGGVLVLGADGVKFAHAEKTFGEMADAEDIVAAAKRAVGAGA